MLLEKDRFRPSWVRLTRVLEGSEPFVFRTKFVDWFGLDASRTAAALLERRHQDLQATGQILAVTAQEVR